LASPPFVQQKFTPSKVANSHGEAVSLVLAVWVNLHLAIEVALTGIPKVNALFNSWQGFAEKILGKITEFTKLRIL